MRKGCCVSLLDIFRFENTSGPETERIRKAFTKLFKNEFSLNIVRETNLKVVSFLDLTLNLSTGKYKPYNKPDNKPLYNNVNSNHPPNIKKNLPESISWRMNKLSYDKTVFNNSKKLFNNALSNSGFDHKMKFQPLTEDKDRGHNKSRGWKIVLFNPLYSCNVAINTGKTSLLLLDKYFSKARKLSKVLDCNNVKVSCNSMPNVASMINAHNKKILTELSNFVWENKHTNTETSLEWKRLDKAKSYERGSRKCMLCLREKYVLFSKLNLLNSCSKLVIKCQHENKFYLSN